MVVCIYHHIFLQTGEGWNRASTWLQSIQIEVCIMREKMQRFMMGRYGTDQLSRFYLAVTLILLVVSMFSRLSIFYLLGIVLLVYTYYRMFSRNVSKMYAQNEKFLGIKYKVQGKFAGMKKRMVQRRDYRFYKCPDCRQTVRVPKGKGKIAITCPKCRTEFIRKS